MSKLRTIAGILKTVWSMSKEDFGAMDRKLLRITTGVVGFVVAALFWFYFLRNIIPVHF